MAIARALMILAVLAVAGPGCSRPSTRTIGAAVMDQTSGTAYAFEVDDSLRQDHSVVIFCNQALPYICYRAVPQDVATAEELRVLRISLDTIRLRRADEAQATPTPTPPSFHYDAE